jgi:hypothetical protein
VQVLRYAARTIGLAGADGDRLEAGFSERLAPAASNDRALGTARDIYLRHARPQIPPEARIGAGLAAAAEFAPAATRPGSYALEPSPAAGSYDLVHLRTGRRTPFGAELHQQGLDLEVVVSSVGWASPERLRLMNLPERQREALITALRTRIVERWFTPEERSLLARGEQTLREVSHQALARAVAALEGDGSDIAIARTLELVELYDSLGRYPPFDVQTRFYRSWSAAAGNGRRLAPIARALGFAGPPPSEPLP